MKARREVKRREEQRREVMKQAPRPRRDAGGPQGRSSRAATRTSADIAPGKRPAARRRLPRRRPRPLRPGQAGPGCMATAASAAGVGPVARARRRRDAARAPEAAGARLADANAHVAGRARVRIEGACRAQGRRLHAAAARAARSGPGRAQGRRAGVDGFGAATRGQVPRVLGRRHRRPDPAGSGRDDLRVQARCGREVQQDHRACPRISRWRCAPSRC